MIFEMRTYHCVPGKLPALMQRFGADTLRLFRKHGIEILGPWTVLIGESSQEFIYLIAWASLEDRENGWRVFQGDPEWKAIRDQTEAGGPLVARLSNKILSPARFAELGKWGPAAMGGQT